MSKWYRATDVPTELDRAASTLPYAPLQKDMEENWKEYRQAFPGLDESSSLVETYAVLQAVFQQNVPLWKRFMDRLSQGLDEVRLPPPWWASLAGGIWARIWRRRPRRGSVG